MQFKRVAVQMYQ